MPPKRAAGGDATKRGSGYIGRRKEHRYEDVGDAKARVAAQFAGSTHVGGAAVVDDAAVWCPEGWTVVTLARGAGDKCAGATYHAWFAPDGAKYRSKKSVERRVSADAARARLIASGEATPASLAALDALGTSDDKSTRAGEARVVYAPTSSDPRVLTLAAAFFRDGVVAMEAPYLTRDEVGALRAATFGFYEDVMRTVTARSLHHDLAVGFDVFRERGRGRFDMNPPFLRADAPAFPSPAVTRADANWRPVAEAVLGGGRCDLIASGVFLALPGAETQTYHTDGVHLEKKRHAAPHAVNVFVPLVPPRGVRLPERGAVRRAAARRST